MVIGDIGSVIDTFTYTTDGKVSFGIKISDGVIAIASAENYRIKISTIEINDVGSIIKVIDSYVIDPNNGCFDPKMLAITSNVFAVIYRGPGLDGWLKTVGISDSGIITTPVLDSLEFDTTRCFPPGGIVHVVGDIYAIGYSGQFTWGYVRTVEINSSGIINGIIDTQRYTRWASQNDIVSVTDNIFAVCYHGSGDDGVIVTLSINAAGNISDVIDSYTFTGYIVDNNIIKVGDNMVAVGYVSTGDDGRITTIEIDNDGNITTPLIQTYEFSGECYRLSLGYIGENVWAVVYNGLGNFTYLSTFKVINGIISGIDSLPHTSAMGLTPYITHVVDNIYAISYQGSGKIKTVDIETPSEEEEVKKKWGIGRIGVRFIKL